MVLFYAFFDFLLTDVKYRADVDDADALMQPLIWLRLSFPPIVMAQLLLTNVDEDQKFQNLCRKFHCPCRRSARSALSLLRKRGGGPDLSQSVPSLARFSPETEFDVIWIGKEITCGKVEESSRF